MSVRIKYPKGETVWVGYYTTKQEVRFIMTSKEDRSVYFLYEFTDGQFKKLGKSKSPVELEEKFDVRSKLLGK
jgi:hypothetical protein